GIELQRVKPSGWNRRFARRARAMDLVFFDRFLPDGPLPPRAFLIDPPADRSPFELVGRQRNPAVTDWNRDHPIFAGLVLRDLEVQSSSVFAAAPRDERLLGGLSGPLALTREAADGSRLVGWGFDFARSDLPLRLAFPQVIVNSLLWMREGRAVDPPMGEELRLADTLWLPESGAPSIGSTPSARLVRLPGLSVQRAEPVPPGADGDPTASSPPDRSGDELRSYPLAPRPRPVQLPGTGLYRWSYAASEALVSSQVLESAESRVFALPEDDPTPVPDPPEAVPEPEVPTAWLVLAGLALILLVGEFWGWIR
ncbi:MAG: hypothetical protein VX498_02880, partial [Myxococcota bacterium]|nr:hypothetical protein [Myxococcota bacterium]